MRFIALQPFFAHAGGVQTPNIVPLRHAQARLRRHRAAVSVHSHTLHSQESLSFLAAFLERTPWLNWLLRQECHADELAAFSFSRLYWTPPLSPRQAVSIERGQIENLLGLIPLVALSDHDSIEAPMSLQVLEGAAAGPVSVEWTVPFRSTFFHFGVYNLPVPRAREAMELMADFTAAPEEARLRSTLAELTAFRHVLVVLNHPAWDEKGIGRTSHEQHLRQLLGTCRPWIHAIEFNGFRPWTENRQAVCIAAAAGLPVVGGGDRHGREPNPVLNLAEAGSFEEWVEQVRYRRANQVLLMPQYEECRRTRVLASICDILRDEPEHALGWRRWDERVFYRTDEGPVVPLREVWQWRRPPIAVRGFVRLIRLAAVALNHPRGRSAVRLTLSLVGNQEAT